mgnify:CR=1 FL=1
MKILLNVLLIVIALVETCNSVNPNLEVPQFELPPIMNVIACEEDSTICRMKIHIPFAKNVGLYFTDYDHNGFPYDAFKIMYHPNDDHTPFRNDTLHIGIPKDKMYEYFGAKRPIICIGKEDGDAADIIHETQTGIVVGFKDKIKLKTELLDFYKQYKSGSLHLNSKDYLKYSRKELAFKIADILNTLN